MWPGDNQDESSKHKHQTLCERNLSDACDAQYKGRCEPRKRHMKRIYSQTRMATAIRQTRSGLLSSPRRRQLDSIATTINEHTASMTKALLRAGISQFIDPTFMKKLVAMKDHLEVVALTIREYKHNNKEQGTPLQVSEARRWFTYLDKILSMAAPEL